MLSEVTLRELRENPVVPYDEDAVTRLIQDDLNLPIYEGVKHWTVAKLREHVLDDNVYGADLLRLSRGLTSEMIAACAKLMSNLDLGRRGAKRSASSCTATTRSGWPGRLSSRLQPNHPSDDVDGILASLRRASASASATRCSASTR